MTPKLEVRGVDYSYHTMEGETKALSDISFHVNSGEFLCIVGPSGCGKSTLLSLLAGLLAPERGEILLDGVSVGKGASGIGYMLQRDHLFEWRTILSNVSVFLRCASVGAFRGDAATGCFDPDSCFGAGSSAS